ncbi:MAG TPA: ClpXP protease specificity-enhancing factor [Gallionella sp.]|nr:MAG: ClpXP protease specificity-enhancing factor [Gallionellales bacterium GWA2_54_124]OGT17389.1 MAG: ClpXP protease specificity-enhancing factor [Gallionellales bacterium RIFOXYD12_FULL_53_10]OGT25174.1 MAG: ClpXP protease specificity-enhancing factor [Gallionellales bacterium RIFOXYD2_FULL_52_7]HCI52846.1 ClpXP protease specificity-enhancing factor [Gallionella sp.]
MSDLSTRPYLIRAIHEWCVDSGLTPYLAVRVNDRTEVPVAYVKDGEIVLNLSAGAVRNMELGNEWITCSGRFGGSSFDLIVPVDAVIGIFAKETGQGLVFQGSDSDSPPPPDAEIKQIPRKPQLSIVK